MSAAETQAQTLPLPLAPQWIRAKEWTPEQQLHEMKRRKPVNSLALCQDPKNSFVYTPRPGDIVVATPPKSGTTWLTHICHQIRMGGAEPDFERQYNVVAWVHLSKTLGIDPNTMPQPADPRVFCAHFPYSVIPKGGKMITCMRDPSDMLLSLYRYLDTILSLKGRVSLPIFCNWCLEIEEMKDVLSFLVDWWEHRHDQDVLFLFFDDLKEDHTGCVRRIAKFMGVDCSEEVISRVVHTTTHAEMVKHHSKFEDPLIIKKVAKGIGDDPPARSELTGRVRKGGGHCGEGAKVLPEDVRQELEKQWREIVTAKLGFKNYSEMLQAWKTEQRSIKEQ